MMILSRIWYVILAILLAAAYYIVSLAVGQYNRRNAAAMDETLKADSQVVSWALQVDARRRLDTLFLASVDPNVTKALRGANGKDIPVASKEEGAKALKTFNDKLPAEYKNDVLFVADREGRLVAQVGYDMVAAYPEFELGGYAAVFDALHGFFRDDTWVWGGRIARVVARPVEDEVGQAPLGAVIGLRWIDKSFAKEIGKRTRTNISFFALGQGIASAATTEGFEESSLDALGDDLKAVSDDKQFREAGRTDVRPLAANHQGGVIFTRLPGDAWELGGGFAVARQKVAISGPLGFLSGADDQDKRSVKLWLVGLLAVGAAGLGILFSFLEHSMPLSEMKRQAERLKTGGIDVFLLPRFRGGLRTIASDVNVGIQRVVEKGGGAARKPADLASILGPVPAQPSMSAFAFPLSDGSAPPQSASAPNMNVPPSQASQPGLASRFPGAPPVPAPQNRPPPLSRPGPGAPGETHSGMPPVPQGLVTAPPSQQRQAPPAQRPPPATLRHQEDEETMVGQPSADLIAATGRPTNDVTAEWHQVFEEFLRTKRECNEPTDGLTFDKFQQTLRKNRDVLMQRHGCKRVKFSVYVKEGRASLKATPVRD